jgi:lipid A 3-O-deacylase
MRIRLLMLMALLLMLMALSMNALAQTRPVQMLRLYEDNDLFTLRGSDRGYTNGTRIDVFYRRPKTVKSIFTDLLLKAGDSSINTYSWGVMHMMYTPADISAREPDPIDYPYSGSLFVSHALHSSNPKRKFLIHTEWIVGVMGKYAYGEQLQRYVHKLTKSPEPMGWDHQLSPALLANLNVTFEKSLFQRKYFEAAYGSNVSLGTLRDGIKFYTTLRLGKMAPYFSGFIEQYASDNNTQRLKSYFILRPAFDIVLHNTLIEGNVFKRGIFTSDSNEQLAPGPAPTVNRFLASADIGWVVSFEWLSASFTYKLSSPDIKEESPHAIGNISLTLIL